MAENRAGDVPVEWLLWGKTGKKQEDGTQAVHPLLCHMLDVAAVARSLWAEVLSAAAREGIAEQLGMSAIDAERWIGFFAGLHDLGKASPTFQCRHDPAYGRLAAAGIPCPPSPPPIAHGSVTALALPDALLPLGLERRLVADLATVLGGHHGVFPSSPKLDEAEAMPGWPLGREPWSNVRRALAARLAEVTGAGQTASPSRLGKAASMLLAGLISVADWIGSDERYFPYHLADADESIDESGADYAKRATARARQALKALHWTGWSPATESLTFTKLFPAIRHPNAMQKAIIALASEVERRPGLVIVEAPMGQGKSEAAMYLADRWSVSLGQRGAYFALPTQATSNQMLGRVREMLAHRYPNVEVNLQLLHGHAALSAEMETLRERGRTLEPKGVFGETTGGAGAASPPDVIAAEWFTARKRGLLAPFGVGTVDQGLLAALRTKHVFVRLFGLGHKVVVVDEVHAYDTYMTSLLERLLEWLGALGSSVVLLSATLPKGRRQRLMEAFIRGLGTQEASSHKPLQEESAPYPRLSWASAAGSGVLPIVDPCGTDRVVRLEWLDGRVPTAAGEPFELGERLSAALSDGGCAAVICNTVRRAQQVYGALKPYFTAVAVDGEPELQLFHAQYLYQDREAREQRALLRFGKPGGRVAIRTEDDSSSSNDKEVHRPHRAVLVATQVVEQSLDLDFDLMVTDMAPIDLLLQRTGRLHRHERRDRPHGLDRPSLWVCRPEAMDGDVPRFGRANEYVYHPHILLRSWLELQGREQLRVPGDVETLIEAVYDDRPCPDGVSVTVHERWQYTWMELARETEEDHAEAKNRWLRPPWYSGALWQLTADPKEEDTPEFHEAFQALTRLGEPTVQVICLYVTPDGIAADLSGGERVNPSHVPTVPEARRLLRRSTTLSDRRVVRELLAQPAPPGWQRSALLRHYRLVELDEFGNAKGEKYQLHLDAELGVKAMDLGGRS